ncbi:MAG: pilin assembly protein [Pseudomonadaceae bacterium]|nr:MAG: pilin assembly protein [Pseudomonadaceae bacterium]
MKIRDLTREWERSAKGRLTRTDYQVRLPLEDAARLAALQEMYPKRRVEDLITDLLGAALEELEASLPYRQGSEVIAEDELGDPMYDDAGPTPRYLELSRKHLQAMLDQDDAAKQS